ncbi:hypothetical protein Tco_1017934 [Tanacetum coccineum]|uniref:Uncharacterized protein n=1 Tax=Tanacetum coccineum TaxID=301880 RepID=A0ABQ5FTZ6_9ASTR
MASDEVERRFEDFHKEDDSRILGVQAKASVESKTPEAYSNLNLEVTFGNLLRCKETYGERNTQGPNQSQKNGDL